MKLVSILAISLLGMLPANSHPNQQKILPYYKIKVLQPVIPIKKIGNACPIGYLSSNGYCVPTSNRSAGVIPIYGERSIGSCPRGFRSNVGYCLSTKTNKTMAIPMISSMCPRDYLQSGSYCLKR